MLGDTSVPHRALGTGVHLTVPFTPLNLASSTTSVGNGLNILLDPIGDEAWLLVNISLVGGP